MRLHSRIYGHSLGVLLVVGLGTSVLFAFGARGAFQREVTERLARHVASLVGESFHDPLALTRRLQQLHEDLAVDVTVRDLDGRVVAVAGPTLPGLPAGEAAVVREGKVIAQARPMWSAATPIRNASSGAVVGTLQAAAHRSVRVQSLLRPTLAVVVVLLIVAVATRPLARRISRPLERLTAAARRLGGGDLSSRVPLAETDRPRRRRHFSGSDELHELTQAFNEMAERVERIVGGQKELLANISHELRSPLARIRVALELLPRGAENQSRLRDVEGDLAELERLIEDVLTTARLEATGLPARLGAVDVNRLLLQVAERAGHDPLTAGKAVRVAEVPPIQLLADESLLRRALWNLVENAAKYGAPPITLAASRAGDHVALDVSDQGRGIAPEERERVLAPFYRLDTARTPSAAGEAPRGVGLGLTLARRVAEVHGGTITIGSTSTGDAFERGCRVTITIRSHHEGGVRVTSREGVP